MIIYVLSLLSLRTIILPNILHIIGKETVDAVDNTDWVSPYFRGSSYYLSLTKRWIKHRSYTETRCSKNQTRFNEVKQSHAKAIIKNINDLLEVLWV